MRAALRWWVEGGEADRGVRLAAALYRFWRIHGHIAEGRRWLDAVLALPGGSATPARATALHGAGLLATEHGDHARGIACYEESVALWWVLGDARGPEVARTLGNLASQVCLLGDYERAALLFEEVLAIGRETGDALTRAAALMGLGAVAHDRGEDGRAWGLLEEALALSRDLGDAWGVAWACCLAGGVPMHRGTTRGRLACTPRV